MPDNNNYNKVYESLVKDDKDIVGMLAYAIYKKQKQETIKDFKLNHSTQPTSADLVSFHNLALQQTQLKMYRKQATDLTQGLANSLLKAKKNDIKDFLDGHFEKQKGFWYGVSQSLTANFIWVVLFAIVAIILWSQEHGPLDTLKSILESNGKQ